MDCSKEGARRSARKAGRRLMAEIAGRYGLELVPKRTPSAPAPVEVTPDPSMEVVPKGQTVRFQTEEYEVLPKGRYDVVERNFYSPIPNLSLLPDDIFDRRSSFAGVDMPLQEGISLIEGELAPFIAEMDVPIKGPQPPGIFYLENENYETVDAELLYALVRARKPKRVVELGSGFTTLLIGDAARRNLAEDAPIEHLAFDPYPRQQIFGKQPPPPTVFEPLSATEVPLDRLAALEAGDILFVDTTHTVKLGSDVNHIILNVLPALASGVLVHFHDIFLPWEYPRVWFEEMEYFWAEQYLLQAFLAFNDAFEVVIPASAVAAEYPERLGEVVSSFQPGRRPGAFWIRRR
ncbi:MAG: class I SAM-dependent methyltransferase [Actinobacteria bacterium]|nr:class I SAM-dependent methyltransferase [Actinomycetota bacterium]